MHVPTPWLRDFIESDADAGAIADALTKRGFAVDGIAAQPMPERIVVGRIDTLAPHPNADKLLVGSVDVGAERLQIVTGATNVSAGDKVPIAMVGAKVFAHRPGGNGVRETKVIEKAKLRGVESSGMMCSPDELALPGEFADGILILDEDAPIGVDFWKAVRYGDAVLDVDVPSNRPDCLSIVGLAREAAAGLGARFRDPDWGSGAGDVRPAINVAIEDPGVCRRLLGQSFSGVPNRLAPMWMTLRLHGARVRSLNFLVDVSNYVQLETGQPLHFYDADRIRGGKIVARSARDGESVVTLDGVERSLEPGTPVIADGEGVVGIAGIFGGADAGIHENTTNVYLESPNFVGARIRRASIALGLRTEGALRHERNLPLQLAEFGRCRAADLLVRAGARPSSVVAAGQEPPAPRAFAVRPQRINALLGTQYAPERMRSALRSIGIESSDASNASFSVTIPWWRVDLNAEVDITEEVARSIGYDAVEERRCVASPQSVDDSLFRQETALARESAALGYREIVTIALQGSRIQNAWERSGIPFWPVLATVINPLSDDQRFLRPSLLPGLLAAAQKAWPKADGSLRLFEIGHVFRPLAAEQPEALRSRDGMYAENGVLEWPSLCALACVRAPDESGTIDRSLLEVKGHAQRLISMLTETPPETVPKEYPYFHPGASATFAGQRRSLGRFGRLHPRLARAYELPDATYAFMLYLENLPRERPVHAFVPLPRYPGTRRDIAVVIDEALRAGELMRAVREAAPESLEAVFAFDEYLGAQVPPGKKSVALALLLRRGDATITDAEADAAVAGIMKTLQEQFGAVLRGAPPQ
jgi:phenylalanyl-tRNA synthetase beta chain